MAKNVFAVVLTEEQAKGAALLRESYPGCYEIAENIFLVADDALTGGIADAAALTREKAEQGVRGAVFRLNGSYTGYTRQSMWEWLQEVESKG